jgi:choline dehydrogenase-like flavoprotein
MNLKEESTYDAIVIGSGISGGYSKELTEKGLKVLMLERGISNTLRITNLQMKALGNLNMPEN